MEGVAKMFAYVRIERIGNLWVADLCFATDRAVGANVKGESLRLVMTEVTNRMSEVQ